MDAKIIKPNFYIVGVPKSGTTSLFYYLHTHPEVFVPKIKEPHFFSVPEVRQTYYNTTIVDNLKDYLKLYKNTKKEIAIGDFSTSYFHNSKSAERIKKFNSKAKIVILLRDPVDRAISHYLMDKNFGYSKVPLVDILKFKEQYPQQYHEYIDLGFYSEGIENYYNSFGQSKVLILLSEELFKDPSKTMVKLLNFIGVNHDFNINFEEKHNQNREPIFRFIKKIRQSTMILKCFNMLPLSIKRVLKKFLFKAPSKNDLQQEKLILKKMYKKDIVKTSQLIGKNLNDWL